MSFGGLPNWPLRQLLMMRLPCYALSFALLSDNEAVDKVRYGITITKRFQNDHGDLAETYAFLGKNEDIAEER
ncbi:hypothetical protein N7E70_008735 [Aminobacter sp. NyZ550]|uniref:hypothetical protein n=1 Tax=Aminobacter sp. NyZ550 TaxID=2979870 RepID=UPI0021D578A5|nr:hypothetical protein [Aminobacter sp. NyZ550]WAX96912.1 hypothetical protein N7E70_008735 [Aminobacter sp. NyZ550]